MAVAAWQQIGFMECVLTPSSTGSALVGSAGFSLVVWVLHALHCMGSCVSCNPLNTFDLGSVLHSDYHSSGTANTVFCCNHHDAQPACSILALEVQHSTSNLHVRADTLVLHTINVTSHYMVEPCIKFPAT